MPTKPQADGGAAIPRIEDHPRYAKAPEARNRLAGEVVRLESELSNIRAVAAEQRRQNDQVAQRLVAGEPLAAVRAAPQDGALERITADLRNARAGLALAEEQLTRTATVAAAELAREFSPHYRQVARRAVTAWLAFIRESHALAELDMQLGPLHGRAGCECPVPRSGNGDPAVQDAHSADVIRQLLDAGTLDARADADLIRGLAVRPRSR
ncbi:MAG: hypothetical protein U0804_17110 [Gemmataceae bacterium]